MLGNSWRKYGDSSSRDGIGLPENNSKRSDQIPTSQGYDSTARSRQESPASGSYNLLGEPQVLNSLQQLQQGYQQQQIQQQQQQQQHQQIQQQQIQIQGLGQLQSLHQHPLQQGQPPGIQQIPPHALQQGPPPGLPQGPPLGFMGPGLSLHQHGPPLPGIHAVPAPGLQGPPLGLPQGFNPLGYEGLQPHPVFPGGQNPQPQGPPLNQPPPFLPQHHPPQHQQQYDLSQPPPSIQPSQPHNSQQIPFNIHGPPPSPQGLLPSVSLPMQIHPEHQPVLPMHTSAPVTHSSHLPMMGGPLLHLGMPPQSLPQPPPVHPPPHIMTSMAPGLPPVQFNVQQQGYGTISNSDSNLSQPQAMVSFPPTQNVLTSSLQPQHMLNQPPLSIPLSIPPPQLPLGPVGLSVPSHPPPVISHPPPTTSTSLPSHHNMSIPPPSTTHSMMPFSTQPPPTVNTSYPPPMNQNDKNAPQWWGDTLSKVKNIAQNFGDGDASHSERQGRFNFKLIWILNLENEK